MEDIELMRLAAKAAINSGAPVTIHPWERIDPFAEGVDYLFIDEFWMPLEDDADCFRLAVSIGINLFLTEEKFVTAGKPGIQGVRLPIGNDKIFTIRRSIVMAAAEVGRSLP